MVLDAQQQIRNLLKEKYVLVSSKNPNYSLRAFSKKLKTSSSSLSEILSGKRNVSKQKALHFCKILRVNQKTSYLIDRAFSESSMKTLGGIHNPYKEIVIEPAMYELFSDWVYFGIISLLRTFDAKANDRNWMAKRLSVTRERIDLAISYLLKWKILEEDKNGNLIDSKACFRSCEEMPDSIMATRQIEILDTVKTLINEQGPKDKSCFFMATTDPSKIEAAINMIEQFGKQLCLFLNDGEKREVYELNINLFPRSTRGGGGGLIKAVFPIA